MSQIARVFVVLNLVIAAGFLFAAGTFLGVKADYIKQLTDEKELRTKDNDAKERTITQLRAQVEDLTQQNNALKEAKSQQETAAAERKARVEALEAEASTKNTQIAGLTADVASLTDAVKRHEDAVRKTNEKNLELVASVAAAQKAEQEAKAAETSAKATIVERDNTIASNERDIKKLTDLNHEKDLVIDWAREHGLDITKAVKMEPVEARVIGVDMGLKLVQFNVGANQKVAKGYTIDVVRGTTYVGRVRIDQVYGDSCAGQIMFAKEGEAPMVGDRGTNTL